MNKNHRQELDRIVRNHMSSIAVEISELEELTRPIPLDSSIGRISRMDAINNKSINDAALRDKKKLLIRLERTLDRLNEADFGVCRKCGSEIPIGRLKIMPHTTRCVNCAHK